MTSPCIFQWTGTAMVPWKRFDNLCKSQFTAGEHYRLGEIEERSMRSHGHYFASLSEAWKNLPERYAVEMPTPEHLRKWALIESGWFDRESIVLKNHDDALALAAYARRDEFVVVRVDDRTVTIYRAKSQSKKAMGAKNFQRSKQDVLDFVNNLLGVEQGTVEAEAGRAA